VFSRSIQFEEKMQNRYVLIVIILFSFCLIAQYLFSSPPSSSASSTSTTIAAEATSTPTSSSPPVTTIEKIEKEESFRSSSSKFQFPRYKLTQKELDAFPDLAALVHHSSQIAFRNYIQTSSTTDSLEQTPAIFETSYQKIECGVVLSNFCIQKGGQPRYFRSGRRFFSSTGAVRCCNEAETKFRFYSEMSNPLPKGAQFPYAYFPNTIIIAPMCWEQYGYHLFLCVINTWTLMSQLRFPTATTSITKLTVKIALLKSWSGNRLGSPHDWWNNNNNKNKSLFQNQDNHEDYKKATFWAWWSVLTNSPANVIDVESHPPMCIPFGVVAGRMEKGGVITPGMQQAFRQAMLSRLEIPLQKQQQQQEDRIIRVTIIDRAKTFKLLNSNELAQQFSSAASTNHDDQVKIETQVVIFESLTLKEQMTIAANTDVMVGMHGNGLTWSAFLESGSALVELWPSYVYNGNYAHFAGRANVRRWTVVGRRKNADDDKSECGKRCNAAIPISNEVVNEVIRFVIGTKITKLIKYNGEDEYLQSQAQYAQEKKSKKKKNNKL
jgi:hypothetical protein